MNKNIFLVIGVFFAVFLGVLLGIITFFKRKKMEKDFKDLENDEVEDVKDNLLKEKAKIVDENTKEWDKFN